MFDGRAELGAGVENNQIYNGLLDSHCTLFYTFMETMETMVQIWM